MTPDLVSLAISVLFGYLALALVPGPNLLVLCSLAALRGFRAALPHALGTASGVAVLAAAAFLLVGPRPASWVELLLTGASVLLLLRAAARLARLRPAGCDGGPDGAAAARSRFAGGFQFAVLNPLVLAHFAAAAASCPGDGLAAGGVAACLAGGAGAIALVLGVLVAAACGASAVRRAAAAAERPLRATAVLLLVGFALGRAAGV
jgi:threonine/homoserine/homoserine lactone efflux protein